MVFGWIFCLFVFGHLCQKMEKYHLTPYLLLFITISRATMCEMLSLFNPGLHSTYKKTQHNRHNGSSAFGVYRKEKGRVGLFSVSFIAPEMGSYLVITSPSYTRSQSSVSSVCSSTPTPSLVNESY